LISPVAERLYLDAFADVAISLSLCWIGCRMISRWYPVFCRTCDVAFATEYFRVCARAFSSHECLHFHRACVISWNNLGCTPVACFVVALIDFLVVDRSVVGSLGSPEWAYNGHRCVCGRRFAFAAVAHSARSFVVVGWCVVQRHQSGACLHFDRLCFTSRCARFV